MGVFLESEGYAVTSTTSGFKLPGLIADENPDLMLLDVMLPGIDGYSLLLQLSQSDNPPAIPVIIITGLPASRSLFEELKQVKFFLEKPFDPPVLLAKIKEILGE